MKASEFDKTFDNGESVVGQLDLGKTHRPGLDQRRVNVDFPSWMVRSIDKEAHRLGVTRQSLIKFWLANRLQHP
jgi:hypothetical protein